MPKYLFEVKYTVDGMKGLMKEGGSKRKDAIEQAIRGSGGRLESLYYAFGERDLVGIVEFPDQISAVSLSGTVNSTGAGSVMLTPLITVEEVDGAVRKSTNYRPPGT